MKEEDEGIIDRISSMASSIMAELESLRFDQGSKEKTFEQIENELYEAGKEIINRAPSRKYTIITTSQFESLHAEAEGMRSNWYKCIENSKAKDEEIKQLKEKEIRGDRMIVDLEHDKMVLKSEIKQLKEALAFCYDQTLNYIESPYSSFSESDKVALNKARKLLDK